MFSKTPYFVQAFCSCSLSAKQKKKVCILPIFETESSQDNWKYFSRLQGTSKLGFPGGATGKESACQCRRRQRQGFNPWVGKIPWSRKWQSTPVFWLGEFHGQKSLMNYSPWGCKQSDTTERLSIIISCQVINTRTQLVSVIEQIIICSLFFFLNCPVNPSFLLKGAVFRSLAFVLQSFYNLNLCVLYVFPQVNKMLHGICSFIS